MEAKDEATDTDAKSADAEVSAGLEELKISKEEVDDKEDTDDLFGPPPRPKCPICALPLPSDPVDSGYMSCCGNVICSGCILEHRRVIKETNEKNKEKEKKSRPPRLKETCPSCSEPVATTAEETILRLEKRMEVNDARAFYDMAGFYEIGNGVTKDEKKAFELYLRSADLGCAQACNIVAKHYRIGQFTDRDEDKQRFYLEMGAKKGYAVVRHVLSGMEWASGNTELAIKHLKISAGVGHRPSLDAIKYLYEESQVSKDEYAHALKSYRAARKEEKSEKRDRWIAEKAERKRQAFA